LRRAGPAPALHHRGRFRPGAGGRGSRGRAASLRPRLRPDMDRRRPLIIDTDPGKDDAVAILLALAAPDAFDLRLMSAAAGNVGLAHTTANILRLCEAVGRHDFPVHAGCPRPILQTLETVPHIHGSDGLAGARL